MIIRRLKNVRKAKRKLAERIVLKLEHPGDVIEQNNAGELFSLAGIGGRDLEGLEKVEKKLIEQTGHTASDLMVLREEQAANRELLKKRKEDFRRAVEGGDYVRFERDHDYEINLGDMNEARRKLFHHFSILFTQRHLTHIVSIFAATNVEDRDDIYLSSSEDEDETIPKKHKSTKQDSGDDDGGDLVFGSDDGGSNSDEREALTLDSDDDVDEYAKALKSKAFIANKKNGTTSNLLTDLDPTDEETKKKRKIESWCKSTELKVCYNTARFFIVNTLLFIYNNLLFLQELMNVHGSESEASDDDGESEKSQIKRRKIEKAAQKHVQFADGIAPGSKEAAASEEQVDEEAESDVGFGDEGDDESVSSDNNEGDSSMST